MEANGSPEPIFETDEDCSYFLAIIPVHALADKSYVRANIEVKVAFSFNTIEDVIRYANNDYGNITNDITNDVREILNREVHNRVQDILSVLQRRSSRNELFERLGITNQSFNRKKFMDPLVSFGWIEKEFPDKQSTKQTYIITESGKRVLSLLNSEL